jgi:hypothetical protein
MTNAYSIHVVEKYPCFDYSSNFTHHMKEMHIVPPNMLSSRFITIEHNRYNIGAITGANNTSIPKRKHKRKKRETNVERVGSTKTRVSRNRCAHQRIPTTHLALWSPAYQAAPSRRDSTTTPLLPGLVLGLSKSYLVGVLLISYDPPASQPP